MPPRYAQWHPPKDTTATPLSLLVSPDGRNGSAQIAQDALIWLCKLPGDEKITIPVGANRGLWVQVFRGSLPLGNMVLNTGDAAVIEDQESIELIGDNESEALVFDLA